MNVLIGCEESGVVRRAFRALGHNAYSCDLEPAEDDSPYHLRCNLLYVLQPSRDNTYYRGPEWDLLIAHPPCTHLAVSGAKWFKNKQAEQADALDFVRAIMAAPIQRIAVENPISIISTRIRKPDQIVEPYWFGHREFKRTCLWLKNLPPLWPTDYIQPPDKTADYEEWKRWNRVHRESPSPNRARNRSRTYSGIGAAMAAQWGSVGVLEMGTAA